MTRTFRMAKALSIFIDPSIPLKGTVFELSTTSGVVGLRFRFEWNTKHQFYTVTIFTSSGKRLGQWDLTDTNCVRLLRGIEPDSANRRDLFLLMQDESNTKAAPRPSNIGTDHKFYLVPGLEIVS